MTEEVLFETDGRVGRIRLNRPKALHALTLSMCEAMIAKLTEWEADDAVETILLDHAEGRGFCAGGDVIALYNSSKAEDEAGPRFFFAEYLLNHLLFTYAKPIVAFMDGVVMGGGVGISQPARHRIATENTRFAMPETGLGLFPDVGGGWYLPRLPGRTGEFLALTGARIDGAECLALGLATHYLPAEKLEKVKERIIADPSRLQGILAEASTAPPEARIDANRAKIDRLFASDRLEEVFAALDADDSEWAAKERATLSTKSPLSCKVSLKQLALGREAADFAANMAMEYRIACHQYRTHDFREGVRALLIDKDQKPRWDPERPEDVSDEMVETIFAPLETREEWTPLR